jgi:predicted regulator of Ras-like GTPase activity (Roadblock/LC7/MglB family)
MGPDVLATERRLADVVAAGTTAVGMCASPKVYQIWARRMGAELARLRLVGSLTGLVGVIRRLEDGTWIGAERLLDMSEALRGLLDRLVSWEDAPETLPPGVVVAAQGCLSALQPSLAPTSLFHSFAPAPLPEQELTPPSTNTWHTDELGRVVEQLRSRTGARAVLLVDRRGQVVAASAKDQVEAGSSPDLGPLAFDVLGRLSPEMVAALPRLEWSHRITLGKDNSLFVSSVGADAILVAVGGADTFWIGFSEADTRSALESLLRRYVERLEGLDTERVEGFEPGDLEDPLG